jgi:hypothetical protein
MKITKSQLKQIIKEELNQNEKIKRLEKQAIDAAKAGRHNPTAIGQLMKLSKQGKYNMDALNKKIKAAKKTNINEDGHIDVPSAIRKLKTTTEDAVQILQALEGRPDEELPSWWMSKLTLASDYLNKARDYLIVPSETMEE